MSNWVDLASESSLRRGIGASRITIDGEEYIYSHTDTISGCAVYHKKGIPIDGEELSVEMEDVGISVLDKIWRWLKTWE